MGNTVYWAVSMINNSRVTGDYLTHDQMPTERLVCKNRDTTAGNHTEDQSQGGGPGVDPLTLSALHTGSTKVAQV